MKRYQAKFEKLFTENELKKAFWNKISKKNVCGLDGICNDHYQFILEDEVKIINKKVMTGTYKFTPFLEKLIIKRKDCNPRQIAIPSKRDQIVLFQMKEFLKYVYEENLMTRLPNFYIHEILDFMVSHSNNINKFKLIKSDITGFYDNIDREKLMNKIRKQLIDKKDCVIRKLIHGAISNYIVPKNYHKSENHKYLNSTGIPQGLSISNILADIYLTKFDDILSKESLLYLRYVDDFLLITDRNKNFDVISKMNKKLKRIALKLNQDKTIVENLDTTFDYLGYIINTNKIRVRNSSIESQIKKIAFHFKHNMPKKTNDVKLDEENKEVFIVDLNEIITGAIFDKKRYGWLFYYSRINDIKILHQLDSIVDKFFRRSELFDKKVDSRKKSFVTAYFKMKKSNVNNASYFHNYDKYKYKEDKIDYLCKRNHADRKELEKLHYREVEIIFYKIVNQNLKKLKLDEHKNSA
jgi:RNA-directed DNA polymerase